MLVFKVIELRREKKINEAVSNNFWWKVGFEPDSEGSQMQHMEWAGNKNRLGDASQPSVLLRLLIHHALLKLFKI